FKSLGAVLNLRAFLLTGHHDVGGDMRDAYRAFGFVHVLPTRPARAHGFDFQILFLNIDIDVVIHHRHHRDRRKTGVTPRVQVIGTNAHQAVHAVFGFQPAIGFFAADFDGG